MTRPPVQPFAMVPNVKEWLATRIAHEVRRNLDDDWTPASAPCIVVAGDPDPASMWPVAVREKLRITAWAAGEDAARDLCGEAVGLLLTHPVPGVATIRGSGAIASGRDPKNLGFFATATLTVTVRTKPL